MTVTRDLTPDKLRRLSAEAATSAEDASRRGDLESDWYARGLRDAYAASASFIDWDRLVDLSTEERAAVVRALNLSRGPDNPLRPVETDALVRRLRGLPVLP